MKTDSPKIKTEELIDGDGCSSSEEDKVDSGISPSPDDCPATSSSLQMKTDSSEMVKNEIHAEYQPSAIFLEIKSELTEEFIDENDYGDTDSDSAEENYFPAEFEKQDSTAGPDVGNCSATEGNGYSQKPALNEERTNNAPIESIREITRWQCSFCSYICYHDIILKSHLDRKHPGKRPFSCSSCNFACNQFSRLKNHIMLHHIDKMYRCPLCSYTNENSSLMQEHIRCQHAKEKVHRCTYCDYGCADASELERHVASNHTSDKTHQCPFCIYKTPNPTILEKHIGSQHSSAKKCPMCDYKCARARGLKTHIARRHMKLFKCSFCDCSYQKFSELETHMAREHTGHKLCKCFPCDYSSVKSSGSKTQMIKRIKCTSCNYNSMTSIDLKSHNARMHTELEESDAGKHIGGKAYKSSNVKLKCYLCHFSCVRLNVLLRHVERKHKEKKYLSTITDG